MVWALLLALSDSAYFPSIFFGSLADALSNAFWKTALSPTQSWAFISLGDPSTMISTTIDIAMAQLSWSVTRILPHRSCSCPLAIYGPWYPSGMQSEHNYRVINAVAIRFLPSNHLRTWTLWRFSLLCFVFAKIYLPIRHLKLLSGHNSLLSQTIMYFCSHPNIKCH